jgi:hypothetical protein
MINEETGIKGSAMVDTGEALSEKETASESNDSDNQHDTPTNTCPRHGSRSLSKSGLPMHWSV